MGFLTRLFGGSNLDAQARKLNVRAHVLIETDHAAHAQVQDVHSKMDSLYARLQVELKAYDLASHKLAAAKAGVENQNQILRLQSAMQKFDRRYESLGHFRAVVSDFIHIKDRLKEKLYSE